MLITYDAAKRDRILRERGLDFERSKEVFAGLTIDILTRAAITASRGSTRSVIWIAAW